MARRPAQHDEQRRSEQLHPVVYKIMVALAVLLVGAAWAFFRHGNPTALLLTVVTIFFIIALAIPYDLWRISRRSGGAAQHEQRYRDWASRELGIWQDRVKGRSAAIEALLPIAAVAIGMVAFAIVLSFAV